MDISQKGIDLIVSFEGKHKKLADGRYAAYLDTLAKPAVPTIYCGLTKGIAMGMVCTEEEGERMFRRELNIYEDAVERLVKVPLNDNEFAAITSFVYNCGVGALEKSTLLKVLNQGRRDQVPAQMMRWINAGGKPYEGLRRRRAAEAALFMEPMPPKAVDEEAPAAPAMPQTVEEVKPSTVTVVKESTTAKVTAVGGIGLSLTQGWEWLFGVAKDASTAAVVDQKSLDGLSALWSYYGVSAGKIGMVIALAALVAAFLRAVQRGKSQ